MGYLKLFLSLFFCVFLFLPNIKAQEASSSKLNNDKTIVIDFEVSLTEIKLSSRERMDICPIIISPDGSETLELPVMSIEGHRSSILTKRAQKVNRVDVNFDKIVDYSTIKNNVVRYRQSVPFEQWMNNGKIEIWKKLKTCIGCDEQLGEPLTCNVGSFKIYDDGTIAEDPHLKFMAPDTLVTPTSSVVDGSAFLTFRPGSSVVDQNFGSNRKELSKILSSVDVVVNDTMCTLDFIKIDGYSSPEGKASLNKEMSFKRANYLKKMLLNTVEIPDSLVIVEGMSENWDDLRQWIVDNDTVTKDTLLFIIDSIEDVDKRDVAIKAIDKGKTYKMLYDSVYPLLRKINYSIKYNYTLSDDYSPAKRVWTMPRSLTPFEMYTVAMDYGIDTKDCKKILYMMADMYPNDIFAINNAAAIAWEHGEYQRMQAYLKVLKKLKQTTDNSYTIEK